MTHEQIRFLLCSVQKDIDKLNFKVKELICLIQIQETIPTEVPLVRLGNFPYQRDILEKELSCKKTK